MTEVEAKSKQEIEQELLNKHEEQQKPAETIEEVQDTAETVETEEVKTEDVQDVQEEKKEEIVDQQVEEEIPSATPIDDQSVLSYIEERYGKQISTIDELLEIKEKEPNLPEDVQSYLKYKQETGRGIGDYAKLQTDYSDYFSRLFVT